VEDSAWQCQRHCGTGALLALLAAWVAAQDIPVHSAATDSSQHRVRAGDLSSCWGWVGQLPGPQPGDEML